MKLGSSVTFGKAAGAVVAAILFLLSVNTFAQHSGGREAPEFCDSSLPPMPNAWRVIAADEVKRFWIRQIPAVLPPSTYSQGYAYDMPHYRRRLEARNALVDRIHCGALDERAYCEAVRHNIRYHRLRGDSEQAERLELDLLRREAVINGDFGTVVKLEELKNQDQLERLVKEQAALIEQLRRDLERPRRRAVRNP